MDDLILICCLVYLSHLMLLKIIQPTKHFDQGRLFEVHLLLLVRLGLLDLLLPRLLVPLPLWLAAHQRLLPLLVTCRSLI